MGRLQREKAISSLVRKAKRSLRNQKFTWGAADWVTAPVAQAMPPEELVAEALGVQTIVVLLAAGKMAFTVPETTVPNVTVTIDSPLTVDITMVAFIVTVPNPPGDT